VSRRTRDLLHHARTDRGQRDLIHRVIPQTAYHRLALPQARLERRADGTPRHVPLDGRPLALRQIAFHVQRDPLLKPIATHDRLFN